METCVTDTKKNYYYYLSVLKVMAMFAVIGIHTFCMPINICPERYSNIEYYLSFIFTNVLKIWAVPIFIMVSGALFLDVSKELTIKKVFSKYIFRMCLILLIFGTFYSFLEIVFTEKELKIIFIFRALFNMLQGKSWDAMWYIYMTIGLYIISIPMRCIIKSANKTEMLYTAVIFFVFLFIFPSIQKLCGIKFGIYIPVTRFHIFYFFMGYLLHKEYIKIPTFISVSFISVVLILIFIESAFPQFRTLEACTLYFVDIYEITGVLFSVGLFSLIKGINSSKHSDFIGKTLAPNSLGVYLFHMFYLNIFYKLFRFTPENYPVFIVWIVVWGLSFFLSFFTTFLLRKISFVKKYIL